MTVEHGGPTVVGRLIAQLNAGEPDLTMCPPEAIAWHNFDEVDGSLLDAFRSMQAAREVLTDLRFDDVVCARAEDDISVARYVVKATLPNGNQLRAPGCLIVTAPNGVITRSQEYLDTAYLSAAVRGLSDADRRRILGESLTAIEDAAAST